MGSGRAMVFGYFQCQGVLFIGKRKGQLYLQKVWEGVVWTILLSSIVSTSLQETA